MRERGTLRESRTEKEKRRVNFGNSSVCVVGCTFTKYSFYTDVWIVVCYGGLKSGDDIVLMGKLPVIVKFIHHLYSSSTPLPELLQDQEKFFFFIPVFL